jgi:hypothetical protein
MQVLGLDLTDDSLNGTPSVANVRAGWFRDLNPVPARMRLFENHFYQYQQMLVERSIRSSFLLRAPLRAHYQRDPWPTAV